MADGQLKKSSSGRLLRTAGGKLKACQCCTTDTEVLYEEFRNCCNQCRSVYFRDDVLDGCVGAPGSAATVLKWRGKCYIPIGTGTPLTLADAEATGRPVVVDNSEVTCTEHATCGAAQAAEDCPACSECCLRWYPSKACLVGSVPSNPQNSICCNLGRQARFISTYTFVNYGAQVGPWYSDATGCHFEGDSWVISINDSWTESAECRWRATCPVGSPCISMTLNTRTRSGVGVPTPPGPGTTTGDCGVTTTGACAARSITPGGRSFCNAYRPHTCLPFSCTGDFVSKRRPGVGGCSPDPLNCGTPGCAGFGLDAYPCYSEESTYSWSCYRSCRSGSWHTTTSSITRPYDFGWYAPGSLCESQIIGVCQTSAVSTTAQVAEWEFIVEDEEGCLSDNTCFAYNGECLEATEGITTPDEICSDPSCEAPPGEEMAPLFAPDSAGGLF